MEIYELCTYSNTNNESNSPFVFVFPYSYKTECNIKLKSQRKIPLNPGIVFGSKKSIPASHFAKKPQKKSDHVPQNWNLK